MFVCLSAFVGVSGVSYGLGTTSSGLARRRREGKDITEIEEYTNLARSTRTVPHVAFVDGSESAPGRTLAADAAVNDEHVSFMPLGH